MNHRQPDKQLNVRRGNTANMAAATPSKEQQHPDKPKRTWGPAVHCDILKPVVEVAFVMTGCATRGIIGRRHEHRHTDGEGQSQPEKSASSGTPKWCRIAFRKHKTNRQGTKNIKPVIKNT